MTDGRTSFCAWVLLWVMLVAAVGLPVVHRLQHGIAHVRLSDAISNQHDHVHTASASFSNGLEDLSHSDLTCDFCGTIGGALSIARVQAPATALGEELGLWNANLHASGSLLSPFIRGPPWPR